MMHKDENNIQNEYNIKNIMTDDERDQQNQGIIDNIRRSLINANNSKAPQGDSIKGLNIANGLVNTDKPQAQESNSIVESIMCSLNPLSKECGYPEICNKKNDECALDKESKWADAYKQSEFKYDSSADVTCVGKIDRAANPKRSCIDNDSIKSEISFQISAARRAIQREVILEFLTNNREMINAIIRDETRLMIQREQAFAHKMITDEVHKIVNEFTLKEVKDRVKELIYSIKDETYY